MRSSANHRYNCTTKKGRKLLVAVAASTIFSNAARGEFAAISFPPSGTFSKITIDPYISCNNSIAFGINRIVLPHWTIEPTSLDGDGTVVIMTDPADLLTASVSNDTMSFEYTDVLVSEDESSDVDRGVIIQVPPSQLEAVSIGGRNKVQIRSGFTKISSLEQSEWTELYATLSDLSAENVANLQLTASGWFDTVIESSVPIALDLSGGPDYEARLQGAISGGTARGSGSIEIVGAIASLDVSGAVRVRVGGEGGNCSNVETSITSFCRETDDNSLVVPSLTTTDDSNTVLQCDSPANYMNYGGWKTSLVAGCLLILFTMI